MFLVPQPPTNSELLQSFHLPTIIFAHRGVASFSLRFTLSTIQGRRVARTLLVSVTLSVAPLHFFEKDAFSKKPRSPALRALPVGGRRGGPGGPWPGGHPPGHYVCPVFSREKTHCRKADTPHPPHSRKMLHIF